MRPAADANQTTGDLNIACDEVEQGAMTTFLTNEGYLALVIFAFVQACCIPISSEITLGFAGVLAYQHHLSLALVIIVGILGELAGSFTAYGAGRLAGRSAVERYRRYLLMTRKDVERVERFFDGRGSWSVALARIIPLVRAFAGLVAGLVEVPAAPFALFNLIGTAIWVTALSLIGYAVGNDWTKASKNFSHASDLLAALVILVLLALILHKWHQIRKERKADAAAAAAPPGTGPASTGPGSTGPAVGGGKHRAPTDSKGG
jgi:membrane protein DedA with SNARE-associated domain